MNDNHGPWAFGVDAACRGMRVELFFPNTDNAGPEAQEACARCPLRGPCLEWALRHEKDGFWGGTNEYDRRRLRRSLGITVTAAPPPPPTTQEDVAS